MLAPTMGNKKQIAESGVKRQLHDNHTNNSIFLTRGWAVFSFQPNLRLFYALTNTYLLELGNLNYSPKSEIQAKLG